MPFNFPNDINGHLVEPGIKDMFLDQMSTRSGVTATAGGGQANAVQITERFTRVTTVGTAADSIKLPPAVPGVDVFVVNAAATNAMNVFPQTGQYINALAVNTALSVAANKAVHFVCITAGTWNSILTA